LKIKEPSIWRGGLAVFAKATTAKETAILSDHFIICWLIAREARRTAAGGFSLLSSPHSNDKNLVKRTRLE
jgi:hypothetical protein